jgi:ankyrin repeat protein
MTEPIAFDAIFKNDLYALTAALDAGFDPNARNFGGNTLLMEAVYCNRLHMVVLLLSRGANVHMKNHFGNTALHSAAWKAVFFAIFSAAGPRSMNFPNCYGWTPLHCLACYGSAEQMAFALSHPGIDVYMRNKDGHTPSDVSINFRTTLQTYGDEEARWQPIRYIWIKLLVISTWR